MADNPNPTEDLGYAHVQKTCALSGAIWRRLAEKDIGIDGIIEMERFDGASLFLATQIKSGPSYFIHRINGSFRLYLQGKLDALYRCTIPVVIIIYDPRNETAYWASVVKWVKENPSALETGVIDILEQDVLDNEAFTKLRSDAQIITTPRLSRDRIREFLEINRDISLVGFVELAKHTLNKTSFRSRTGIQELEFLQSSDLLSYEPNPEGGPGYWSPTEKGCEYIEFMLGNRYFLPFMLIHPTRAISTEDIDMCEDFETYIDNSRRKRDKKKESNPECFSKFKGS